MNDRVFDADIYSVAGKLALELECLLIDTKDLSVVSKWWDSAHDALEQWRSIKDTAPTEQTEQEPVAELTDDEIYDAAYATFCRGPNTRELFRMMWTCNPPCSIGWDRDELKAFARHIASLYTAPPKAEQEPVAVVEITYGREPECYVTGNVEDLPEGVFKLYTAPQPVNEQK